MEQVDSNWQQAIRLALGNSPGEAPAIAARLWLALSSQLIPLIGHGGVAALFGRSVHLTAQTYPWLTPSAMPHAMDDQLTGLMASLEAQPCAVAAEASRMLLQVLIGILLSLIGESMTIGILGAAWGRKMTHIESIDKEPHHE